MARLDVGLVKDIHLQFERSIHVMELGVPFLNHSIRNVFVGCSIYRTGP